MIKQETVMVAAPIVIDRVGKDVKLIEKVSPLIESLNSSTVSLEGYSLDDIVERLSINTEGDSEHTQLVEEISDTIAPTIRQSLNAIAEYVIPTCDKIESVIKSVTDPSNAISELYKNYYIRTVTLHSSLLNSILFQGKEDEEFVQNVSLKLPDFTKINCPEKTEDEVKELLGEVVNLPEFNQLGAVNRCDLVDVYDALFNGNIWWVINADNKTPELRLKDIKLTLFKVKSILVLNALLCKLDLTEEPITGLTGISLEEYRFYIHSLRRFVGTLVNRYRELYENYFKQGIVIDYDKTENEYSISAYVNEEVIQYFYDSETYSLNETILGMFFERISDGPLMSGDFITRVPAYTQITKEQYTIFSTKLSKNIKEKLRTLLETTVIELAEGPIWKDYLDGLEGLNNSAKLATILSGPFSEIDGDYLYNLTRPAFIADIHNGQRVSDTVLAVNIAYGIGVPIAGDILKTNLTSDNTTQKKQRINLSRSIISIIVSKLLK